MRKILVFTLLALALTACAADTNGTNSESNAPVPAATAAPTVAEDSNGTRTQDGEEMGSEMGQGMGQGMGSGMGEGMGSGMMAGRMDPDMRARHQAPVPDEYAGLLNPIPSDSESLARGEQAYALFCTSCHGEGGLGDGVAATALDPAPRMIAMTSRMMGDDYLFWRISEGGTFAPFNSAMPPWKASLDETTRWDLVNYMRVLDGGGGPGGGGPGQGSGRGAGMEEAMRAEMLAAAEKEGVLSAEEIALFDEVHNQIDARLAKDADRQLTGNMSEIQSLLLQELVDTGEVSAEDAAAFDDIHDRLLDAGLMN